MMILLYYVLDKILRKIQQKNYLIGLEKNLGKIYIGSICTGTYVLAKAGLINDIPSTIHWENREALKEEFEHLNISDAIYTIDKNGFLQQEVQLQLI